MSQESLEPAEEFVAPAAEADENGTAVEAPDVSATEGEDVAADQDAQPEADGDAEVDPVEEFKAELRRVPGDWYVIHSYAGYENRVKVNLENRTQSLNMEDYIFQVEVPMEEVTEIKNAQKKVVRRVRIPGYVLVRMDLTDESWGAVRHTPGVTGFVGHTHQPVPLTFDEVFSMLAPSLAPKPEAAKSLYSDVLRTQGYRTGFYGKWHTKLPPGNKPQDHFDAFEDIHRTPYFKKQPDGSLKLWIRPIETAHERRFTFHYNPDGTVQVKNEMEPKFEDLVIYNFVFLGLPLPNTGSENFVKQAVHRLGLPLIEPDFTAKLQ